MKKKVLLIAFAALALTACSSKKATTDSESDKKAASSISSSNVVKQTSNKINLTNYKKIKVVEKTGSTPSQVTDLLGREADAKSKAKTSKLPECPSGPEAGQGEGNGPKPRGGVPCQGYYIVWIGNRLIGAVSIVLRSRGESRYEPALSPSTSCPFSSTSV